MCIYSMSIWRQACTLKCRSKWLVKIVRYWTWFFVSFLEKKKKHNLDSLRPTPAHENKFLASDRVCKSLFAERVPESCSC